MIRIIRRIFGKNIKGTFGYDDPGGRTAEPVANEMRDVDELSCGNGYRCNLGVGGVGVDINVSREANEIRIFSFMKMPRQAHGSLDSDNFWTKRLFENCLWQCVCAEKMSYKVRGLLFRKFVLKAPGLEIHFIRFESERQEGGID